MTSVSKTIFYWRISPDAEKNKSITLFAKKVSTNFFFIPLDTNSIESSLSFPKEQQMTRDGYRLSSVDVGGGRFNSTKLPAE